MIHPPENVSVELIGHTDYSLSLYPLGMGEMINTQVLQKYLGEEPFQLARTSDLYEELGIHNENFDHYRRLVDRGVRGINRRETGPHVQLIATHIPGYAAALASGILKGPTIARIYVLGEYEEIHAHLYRQADVIITQTLLANERAMEEGIPPWQLLYVPYQQLEAPQSKLSKENYFKRLGKSINANTVVVGCSTRFQYRKNVEFVIRAFDAIHQQVPEALLLLRGDFDSEWDQKQGEGYTPQLKALIESVQHQPWFAWDRNRVSHEEAMEIFSFFDLGVHLSGAEDPCNTVIEWTGLGIPTVVVDGGVRPYLFKNAVEFVTHQGTAYMRYGWHEFVVPDPRNLKEKLLFLIRNREAREALGKEGQRLSLKRFGPSLTRERLKLLIQAAHAYHHNTSRKVQIQKQIETAYEEDRVRFDL